MRSLAEVRGGYRRKLGAYRGAEPGPLVLCIGGIHGNEPSGIGAARSVLADLERRRPPFRGEFVALAGNLRALARDRRFVDRDLNRDWIPDRIEALRKGSASEADAPEDAEQRELLDAIDEALARHREGAYFLDLHTTSAEGPPFLTIGDTLRNRSFAARFPLPVILGLEEQIDGPLLEYVNNLGHVTIGAEGGQHTSPDSEPNLASLLWLALVAAGNIAAADVPGLELHHARLAAASAELPRVVEVRGRHAVCAQDGFRMNAGYRNLTPVGAGEVVANDRSGPIRVTESGWLLLPLYQGLGNDGFFFARAIGRVELELARSLRRIGLPRVAHWLPGVRRHPKLDGVLTVNTRVARFYPEELFWLLGYRKRRRQGDVLVVSRRSRGLRTSSVGRV